jgi:hypothetical protein
VAGFVGDHPNGGRRLRGGIESAEVVTALGLGQEIPSGENDIAWYNASTGNIDVWSLANGHWSASSDLGSHPAGWQPLGAGDFNGDGTSDIAWFNPATNNIDIWLLQNGHWSTSANVGAHPVGSRPAGIGDFNGDGTSDILWDNAGTGTSEVWKSRMATGPRASTSGRARRERTPPRSATSTIMA